MRSNFAEGIHLTGLCGLFRVGRGNIQTYPAESRLRAIDGPQLPHDPPDMHLDRRLPQIELPCDQLIRRPQLQAFKHLPFPSRQPNFV
jgi:hypothetical protein